MDLFIFLLLVVSIIGLYVLTHLSPLTVSQITALAKKKRKRRIREYFSFSNVVFYPDNDFKKQMNPNGSFYNTKESLYYFPSISASHLKHKKHEWIIFGFEKNKIVELLWVNKGIDREYVSSYLSKEQITNFGSKNNYSSVLIFHNHPNTNPNKLDFSSPSQQDLASAREFAKYINAKGLNLIEFVCERGKHYEYFRSASDRFCPLISIIEEVKLLNGKSKMQNLHLHLQRIF